ncbi:hypothetical protein [Rhizobium binxianense]
MWRVFRKKKAAMDPADVVALSVLLDEWCRRQGINQRHPRARDAIRNLIAWRQAGTTINRLRQLLAADMVK